MFDIDNTQFQSVTATVCENTLVAIAGTTRSVLHSTALWR